MTAPLAEQDDASTPLSPEEREGLIPSYITLRGELNEAEQANILEADAWAFSRKRDVLDEGFLNTLHKHMYGNVWRWAPLRMRRCGEDRALIVLEDFQPASRIARTCSVISRAEFTF